MTCRCNNSYSDWPILRLACSIISKQRNGDIVCKLPSVRFCTFVTAVGFTLYYIVCYLVVALRRIVLYGLHRHDATLSFLWAEWNFHFSVNVDCFLICLKQTWRLLRLPVLATAIRFGILFAFVNVTIWIAIMASLQSKAYRTTGCTFCFASTSCFAATIICLRCGWWCLVLWCWGLREQCSMEKGGDLHHFVVCLLRLFLSLFPGIWR